MIRVENLCVSFHKMEVLHQVSAEFDDGQITGIMGRNGSGKTVLLKAMCGMCVPESGKIRINDQFLTPENVHRFSMGTLIESPGFLPDYTGFQNLQFLASLTMKDSKERVRQVMELTGLDWKSRKKVKAYSLGMRQRLGISQVLLENPDIMILDEPMNGLDQVYIKEFREMLKRFREEGKTIIIASHYMEDLNELCDVTYKMDNGKIVKE